VGEISLRHDGSSPAGLANIQPVFKFAGMIFGTPGVVWGEVLHGVDQGLTFRGNLGRDGVDGEVERRVEAEGEGPFGHRQGA
jgi:hypothetical protein